MKDELVTLSETFPRLSLAWQPASDPQYVATDPRESDEWTSMDGSGDVSGTTNNIWFQQKEIDVSGWPAQGLTFYPTGFRVQQAPLFQAMGGDSFAWMLNVITQSPFDVRNWAANLNPRGGTLPTTFPAIPTTFDFKEVPSPFRSSTQQPTTAPPLEYTDFLGGVMQTWATSDTLPNLMQVVTGELDFSMLTPTASDRLYITRLVAFQPQIDLTGGVMQIPSCRFLMTGMVSKESNLSYIMRLKDSYKLAQTDVGLVGR